MPTWWRRFDDPTSVLLPRLKNRWLAWMHGQGPRRFEEREFDLGDGLRLLRHDVALNGLEDRVCIHAAAVFRPGVPRLRIYESYTNTGGHTAMGALGPARQVACTSLDRILEDEVPGSASAETLGRIDRLLVEVQDHPILVGTSLREEPECRSEALLEHLAALGLHRARDPRSWVAVLDRELE